MLYNIKNSCRNSCFNWKQFIKFVALNNLFIVVYLLQFAYGSNFHPVSYYRYN
jgi:hypothetical protein